LAARRNLLAKRPRARPLLITGDRRGLDCLGGGGDPVLRTLATAHRQFWTGRSEPAEPLLVLPVEREALAHKPLEGQVDGLRAFEYGALDLR